MSVINDQNEQNYQNVNQNINSNIIEFIFKEKGIYFSFYLQLIY